METSSHENSALAEEYEEEINNLKSKIKSMEFQIADLKSFIINQKHLHAKQVEQLKQTHEASLEQTVIKHNKEIQALQHKIFQTEETSKHQSSDIVLEIANFVKNCSQEVVESIQEKVNSKLEETIKRIVGCQQKLAVINNRQTKAECNRKLQVLGLSKELSDKNTLLERQRVFLDKMIQQKKESDQIYEKQLSFLEEVYRQRRNMCCRLEKVNSELRHENNTIRQQIGTTRRHTEGMQHPTICINLEDQQIGRVVKTSSHFAQSNQRHTPKLLKKSTPKLEYDSMSGISSPLRLFKINDNKRLNSVSSPPSKQSRSGCSISRHITKSTVNIGKRISTKTIDIFCNNPLQLHTFNKLSKEKENVQLTL